MQVSLQAPHGQVKRVKLGFSWTTFFFGFFVPLVRGDFKWFLIMLFSGAVFANLTHRLESSYWNLAFMLGWAIFYNRLYIKDLLTRGWRPLSAYDAKLIAQSLD